MIKFNVPSKRAYANEGTAHDVGEHELLKMIDFYSILNPISIAEKESQKIQSFY